MIKVKLTERERDFLWSFTKQSCGATTQGHVITSKRYKFTDDEQCVLMEKLDVFASQEKSE